MAGHLAITCKVPWPGRTLQIAIRGAAVGCCERAAAGEDGGMDTEPFLAAACELLAVRSTADRPGDLHKALGFVVGFVGPGFTVERFESGGKPSALIYRGAHRPHFRIILNAHLDVVSGAAAQFRPRLEGDRLYARGAQDMKVSALIEAQVFGELAGALPYPLGLQLVTDEEVGGRHGTLHQIEQGVTGEFVIIGEQSGLRIVTDSKGMITTTLRAAGRSGHAAYPWQGDNALIKLQASLARLLAAYPPATEEAWRTTINLARIQTPNRARNQIPARAEAWLDIRYPPDDTHLNGKTIEEITAYLASFCEPGVTPLVEHADPPHHADQYRPEIRSLQQAAASQGYHAGFLRKHGAADGRFYYQQGTDAVIFGIGGDGLHGPDEYADTTTITPYYRALKAFLHNPGGQKAGADEP
jgi:succinyl-diaminopimelate desuccinylase